MKHTPTPGTGDPVAERSAYPAPRGCPLASAPVRPSGDVADLLLPRVHGQLLSVKVVAHAHDARGAHLDAVLGFTRWIPVIQRPKKEGPGESHEKGWEKHEG